MGQLTIRGLPSRLANDAWWMADTGQETALERTVLPADDTRDWTQMPWITCLALLVVIADLLFWEHPVGISLIVFSAALTAAALMNLRPNFNRSEWSVLAALWVAFALPLVEYYQTLSVLFLILGHTGLLVWCAKKSTSLGTLRMVLRFPFAMIAFIVMSMVKLLEQAHAKRSGAGVAGVVSWILPLSVGAIFFLLFVGANPMFERFVNGLGDLKLDYDTTRRIAFWVVIAAFVLPFVLFKTFERRLKPLVGLRAPSFGGAIVNAKSVTNSLLLFNAMFFMQNLSDITVLWGGAELPDGMTYATYAHRGAYPLMWTSVLAGMFALISRPFSDGSGFIKALLLVWVMQNVVLLCSALMRLDLYIDVYGLTYLRVRVAIGMFLVLVGMMLLVWQLWKSKSSIWLTRVFAGFALGVFYICCFVNFGFIIAASNLERAETRLDTYYLCEYTASGVKAMYRHVQTTGEKPCDWSPAGWSFGSQSWRDWSFRQARLSHYRALYLQAGTVFSPDHSDSVRPKP